jgi:hypothetical protein
MTVMTMTTKIRLTMPLPSVQSRIIAIAIFSVRILGQVFRNVLTVLRSQLKKIARTTVKNSYPVFAHAWNYLAINQQMQIPVVCTANASPLAQVNGALQLPSLEMDHSTLPEQSIFLGLLLGPCVLRHFLLRQQRRRRFLGRFGSCLFCRGLLHSQSNMRRSGRRSLGMHKPHR